MADLRRDVQGTTMVPQEMLMSACLEEMPDRPDESALCTACGLCCQGQLFTWVELRPEEIAKAETWPVEFVKRKDLPGFKQPCGCFREMRCTVYAERPKTCIDYSCQLLQRFRRSEIAQAEAQAIVAEGRSLFDQIQAELPVATDKALWRRIGERWELSALQRLLADGELSRDTLMAIVALDVLLQRHFREKPEPPADVAAGGVADPPG